MTQYGIKKNADGTFQVGFKDQEFGWLEIGRAHPTKRDAQVYVLCQQKADARKEDDWMEQALWRTCLSDPF